MIPLTASADPPNQGILDLALAGAGQAASRLLCQRVGAQTSTSDGLRQFPAPAGWRVMAFGCMDVATSQAGITTPYTITLKDKDGNQIGPADTTCVGNDQLMTFNVVQGDPDGLLAAGEVPFTDVSNSPNPATTTIQYCTLLGKN